MIDIVVNGEPKRIAKDCTISELLQTMDVTAKRIAVEVNMEIVPRSLHEATVLSNGDAVEVVQAIGGG